VDRKPAVAGTFYPKDETLLREELKSMFAHAVQKKTNNVRAIIVPHAGYVFSGTVAASAYKQIEQNAYFENIFIIASSHHSAANIISTYNSGNYKTPLGDAVVNSQITTKCISETDFIKYLPEADAPEHSIEVQLPFIKYWLNESCKIVPFIICSWNIDILSKFSKLLEPYFNEKNLFIISTDFSHYPSYSDAVFVDKETTNAILTNSSKKLLETLQKHKNCGVSHLDTDLCGWTSVLALLKITEGKKNVSLQQIDYANSGDSAFGDKFRVVGYSAIAVTQEKPKQSIVFSQKEQITLLAIARESICKALHSTDYSYVPDDDLTKALMTHCGAFVTLHIKGELRGCKGRFGASQPLYEVVKEMARASAFEDYRFHSVTADELKELEIEISVMTPLKKINSIDEIELGKHGIYIVKGLASGTFLPQVATETKWTKEEFLGHCAKDKAGLDWNGWKDAEIFTYETIIFSE
jgi:MEMO1 family protein